MVFGVYNGRNGKNATMCIMEIKSSKLKSWRDSYNSFQKFNNKERESERACVFVCIQHRKKNIGRFSTK